MPGLLEDSVYKVVQDGIKEDIEITLANNRFRAALILIYSGIDTMAYASLPQHQLDVASADFIRWADRFIRFPCKDQVSGEELYSARCALLHTSGVESSRTRNGRCRKIGYVDKAIPEVRFAPKIDADFVVVSILGLKDAFFKGINEFLITAFANSERRPLVEARIEKMVQEFAFAR